MRRPDTHLHHSHNQAHQKIGLVNTFYNYRYLLPKGVFKGQTELFKSKYKDEIVYFINKEIQRTSKEKTLEANTN